MTARPPQSRSGADPEKVLSQALRVLAGGRPAAPGTDSRTGPPPASSRGLTTTHILLIAAIVGVMIGMGAGLLTIV